MFGVFIIGLAAYFMSSGNMIVTTVALVASCLLAWIAGENLS
jgi:hypothetical protein